MKKNTLFFTSFFILFFLFFQIKNINAQTTLQPGDIVVLGYNTNVSPAATSNCGNNYNTDDMIVLMTMVDIANNTEIIITDRGYLSTTSTTTHIFDGLLEGAVTFRRTGGTLAKGTVFQITFGTAGAFCGGTIGACGQGWTTTEVFLFPPSYATLDMNSTSGDNLFILQGNFTNDTDFTGKFLYGLSTTGSWVFSNSNRAGSSNLPPMLGACLSRTTNDADKSKYNGTLTTATKSAHLSAISNNANWSTTLPNMNPTCPTSSTFTISNLPATFTINANPTNIAGADQIICGNSTNMQATGTGTWTLINGTATITTPTSATTSVTGLGTGTNTLRWITNNCAIFDVNITASSAVVPSVSITTPNLSLCPNQNISFEATPTNGGTNPSYQWKINNVNAGTNSPSFASNTLQAGDQISVIMTSNANCVSPNTATSNVITILANVTPSVSIASNNPQICANNPNTFTANVSNGGANPSYQWKINGVNAGTGQATFTTNTLQENDVVSLLITSNALCASPNNATSNNLIAVVCATPPPPPPAVRNDFFVPELFTPNGDNKNDVFVVKGNKNEIVEFAMKIYDRYGNVVSEINDFESASQIGWNGKKNDKQQPTGVYFWEIKGKFANGNNIDYKGKTKGQINLLR